MLALLFLLSYICPETKMINKSKLPWVDWDYNRMNYCKEICPSEYKDAKCLKEFWKLGYQNYFCLCGNP